MGWMDCPPVSPGGGSEVPEALLEPGVGTGKGDSRILNTAMITLALVDPNRL